jgi:hypothetical protein
MYGHDISTFPKGLISSMDCQCLRNVGKADTNYRGRRCRRGPGLDCVAHVYVFLGSMIICGLYKLTPLDQAQVSTQIRVFPIYYIYFYSARPCWGQTKFFLQVPEHAFGGRVDYKIVWILNVYIFLFRECNA